MTDYPPALLDHLGGIVTTLCHCWVVRPRNGQARGYTDHDRPLSVGGVACLPASGFTASEARERLGLAVDTADVEAALSADDISAEDIAEGRYDGAGVDTFLVNWQAPAQHAMIRRAVIGRIMRADGRFVAELESVTRDLDRASGRYVRRSCDAELGDARCRFNLGQAGFSGGGAVLSAPSEDRIVVGGLDGFEGGWFSSGMLTWTGGAHAGSSTRVMDHVRRPDGVSLTLWQEGRSPPAAGDGFSVTAGCDKLFATCISKFSNRANFRGFPHLPGNDAAYGYVTEGAVFDGSPIVR